MNETMTRRGTSANETPKTEESQARACPPYIARGSALPPTPFSAPPFFEAFREASRKGAFLNSDRLTPHIHQSGASCLAPSRASRGEEKGAKTHALAQVSLCSSLRVLGPLFDVTKRVIA